MSRNHRLNIGPCILIFLHSRWSSKMEIFETLKLLNFSFCLLLTGVIWVIQLVHYPAFQFVSEQDFTPFHNFHSARISALVIPLMLAELICSVLGIGLSLLARSMTNILFWSFNLTAIIGVWASTFLITVPLHNQLSIRKDFGMIRKLVSTNWIRTVLWTFRTLILVWSIH
jgi:hypothetical protein